MAEPVTDMTDQEKRIKLALAVGWKHCQMRENLSRDCWQHPIRKSWFDVSELPDPFHDANHCHALITHLNGLGWHVEITHYAPDHAEVSIEQHPEGLPVDWEGDNWMHGVCELALKVIENERLLRAAQEPCPLA